MYVCKRGWHEGIKFMKNHIHTYIRTYVRTYIDWFAKLFCSLLHDQIKGIILLKEHFSTGLCKMSGNC